MSDDILEINDDVAACGADPLHLDISDKTKPVATIRTIGDAERKSLRRAVLNGWNLIAVSSHYLHLSRGDGNSPGTVGINRNGRMVYCPF